MKKEINWIEINNSKFEVMMYFYYNQITVKASKPDKDCNPDLHTEGKIEIEPERYNGVWDTVVM